VSWGFDDRDAGRSKKDRNLYRAHRAHGEEHGPRVREMTLGNSGPRVGGYVLAGGGSTRFGRDKALVEFAGKPMLARMIELLKNSVQNVRIVAQPGKYTDFQTEIVPDGWPGAGPLGGIVTALLYTQEHQPALECNLIVSCDMPFLTLDWMKYLAGRAAESSVDVLLPCSMHGPEPLCACYRTGAAQPLRSVFESGVRKVTAALKQVATEVLDERDWKRFDSAGRLFWNMNTAADYDEARRILQGREIDLHKG
jgi:molybdopterin-guanine dinucleotide biosynthesis protein A